MAREIRDLFLHVPVPVERCAETPLFVDNDMQPFKGTFVENMLQTILRTMMSAEEAKEYSPHSFRIYLACALRASGHSDAEIQACCRWQSLDSLRTYALLDPQRYTKIIDAAMAADSEAVRVHHLPSIDAGVLLQGVQDFLDDQDAPQQED